MSSIPKLLKLKDYTTLLGTTLGLLALLFAGIGTHYTITFGFFLISLTLGTDLLDGYIARKTGTVNEIGRELDSLSDSLTFGVAPAILTFQAFRTGELYDIVLMIGCIIFALGSLLRLARFNISTEKGYMGVPTPITALEMIVFYFANYFYAAAFGGLSLPYFTIFYYSVPAFLILFGWLNITTHLKYKEKSKSFYYVVILIAPIVPVFGIVGLQGDQVNPLVYLTFSIIFLCIFFGSQLWQLFNSIFKWINKIKKKQ
ncbi:MAG: CDP-alcohol phosphatidyltransferase family protein [Promethearchaeota archaeon]